MQPDVPTLDPTQRAVLALPAGASAVVLGAPGTGKTSTLIEFAADRILTRGFGTAAVLALAPRRTQAARLRDALLQRVGVPAGGPLARTTASLAFDVARRSAVIESRPQPVLLTGGEQDALIAQLLVDTTVSWPDRLGPDVRRLTAFRTELRDVLARATERGVGPDGIRDLARRTGHAEWDAVADFAHEYFDVVSATYPDAFDSAELVSLAAAGVQRGTAGETVDALRVVLVDDLHDATESTVTLLASLAARGVAIVGFGDPDVAVDTFRGGEPELLGRFGARLGLRAPVRFVLGTVHRNSSDIRRLVTATTTRIGTALAGDQRAATVSDRAATMSDRAAAPDAHIGHPDSDIDRITASTGAEQALAIAQVVRERHLRHGIAYRDQAVVVRSGALAEPLARALQSAGVPTIARTTGQPLRTDRAARSLLEVVATGIGLAPLTPETAVDLLTGPFGGLDGLALRRLRLALRAEELAGDGTRGAGELLVEALGAPGRLVTIDAAFARRAGRLAETLHAIGEREAAGDSVEQLLWLVWERSGLAGPWRERALAAGAGAAEANRDLDGVVALFTAAARAVERAPDDPPAAFLTAQLSAEVPDDTLAPRAAGDSLLVTTPVGVAGLEFDTVVIAGLQEGVWPNLRPRGSLLAAGEFARALASEPVQAPDSVARPTERPQVALPPSDDRKTTLFDELRLFALAASRARCRLVLTAVVNDEESPSVLLSLGSTAAGSGDGSAGVRRFVYDAPNTLRPLVGVLRRTLVSGPEHERVEAAAALARLAQHAVPGADPAEWHGLQQASTTAPIVSESAAVRVSPSGIDNFEKSAVDWFVDRVAGSEPRLANAVGTMLHWVMETATVPDEAAILALLEARWGELDFEADWIGAKEHRLAIRMAAAIGAYLRARSAAGAALIGGETPFEFEVGRARVGGTIDRVEQDPDGAVLVVDLKTGAVQANQQEAAQHAQLGAYQLAVLAGVVPGVDPEAPRGGAALLYVKTKTKAPYKLVTQEALDPDAAQAFRERLSAAADGMSAASFAGPLEVPRKYGSTSTRPTLARVPEVCSD